MWRQLIAQLYPDVIFHPPATPQELAEVEAALDTALPTELAQLLLETNGVEYASGIGLVWPTGDIAWRNLDMRRTRDARLYTPFDNLLFFADSGDGQQFAFRLEAGTTLGADVVWWAPISDDRTHVASSLREYIEWVLRDV